jgi:hypothetical protein
MQTNAFATDHRNVSFFSALTMPQPSTLKHVADIVIRRVLAHADTAADLPSALDREYPFGDDPQAREIWLNTVRQHALNFKG